MEELLWDAFPQYLAIGMSAEEYWHGPLDLAVSYRRAWRARREAERDEMFASEWRHGQYTLIALSVALSKAFGGKSSEGYPDSPLYSSEQLREAAREERERREMERTRELLRAKVAQMNKRFLERQGGDAAT